MSGRFALLGTVIIALVAGSDINVAAGKIAFVSNRDGNFEVYVMNDDGSNPVNLTQHSADDREPA